jgi:gamma-glutamyltranspeptidase/glutathione hydrolase
MHTLNAYMVMREGRPYLVGGTPGGDRQIAWNAQVITNVLDHGMSAQEAVEAPRWASFPSTDPHDVEKPFVVELEGGMVPGEVDELRAKGHTVSENTGRAFGGSAKLIVIDPATDVRTAGSDPRTDGHAAAV